MTLQNTPPAPNRFFDLGMASKTLLPVHSSLTITPMKDDNPFGSESRRNIMKDLLDNGLVRRITIIEGSYPTDKEQRAFIQRIIDLLNRKHEQ